MFALLAHITMEEEPLLAAIGGIGIACGALGAVIASYFARRRAEVKNDS
jgi:hypothetical protein